MSSAVARHLRTRRRLPPCSHRAPQPTPPGTTGMQRPHTADPSSTSGTLTCPPAPSAAASAPTRATTAEEQRAATHMWTCGHTRPDATCGPHAACTLHPAFRCSASAHTHTRSTDEGAACVLAVRTRGAARAVRAVHAGTGRLPQGPGGATECARVPAFAMRQLRAHGRPYTRGRKIATGARGAAASSPRQHARQHSGPTQACSALSYTRSAGDMSDSCKAPARRR